MIEDNQLSIDDRILILSKIPVFNKLKKNAFTELANLLIEKKTRAQEPIFKKGEVGQEMYILIEGEVRIHDGNHVLTRLTQGDFFGEFALIDSAVRSASVTTEKPCLLLQLRQIDFLSFSETHPEVLLGILQTQVKRMRDMNELEDKLSKSYVKISKIKQELEIQHQAVNEQKQQLLEQNEQLTELNEFKRKTTSVLIHGLKNPMTSAMTMAEMLLAQTKKGSELSEYADILRQSLLRMDDVLNQLIRTNEKEEI
ncbi:MAG: cyclic nucleotide-binding protein [Bacteroidetes bacterium]|nr:MAG: cyclic nucleotide-binding protein [Bacteroidota bacterium]